MANPEVPSATAVTVYTGHTPECPKQADRCWKRCNCPKWLYIRENGTDKRMSAKTRAWDRAEDHAQPERDKRDPRKRRMQEIEDREVQRADLRKAKNITVTDAVDRWLRFVQTRTAETAAIYNRAGCRIEMWAADW
jgi:hypothetical protein